MPLHTAHRTSDYRPRHGHVVLYALAVILALLCLTRPAHGASTLSADSPPCRTARKLLPDHFREYETTRFIILSDASPAWTRQQASRLERVHHQFLRFARRLDLDPQPLRHKLVCILFDRREDYVRFARANDEAEASWIAGYYAPHADRVVFYNLEQDTSILEAQDKLERMQREVQSLERDAGRARQIGLARHADELQRNASEYRRHVDRERLRLEDFANAVSVATTVHEAVHQLMFHTGLQSVRVEYPVWISEGLATAFETADPDLPFGPDREFDQRRAEFIAVQEAGELLPLRQLVQVTDLSHADEEDVRRVYHQSYSLVTWMYRYRTEELRRYLMLMRRMPAGVPTPAQHIAFFERCFGDVDKLEREWLRHEYRLYADRQSTHLAEAHEEAPQ